MTYSIAFNSSFEWQNSFHIKHKNIYNLNSSNQAMSTIGTTTAASTDSPIRSKQHFFLVADL